MDAGTRRPVQSTAPETWPSGRRHSPAKGAYGPKPVSRVRIPASPPAIASVVFPEAISREFKIRLACTTDRVLGNVKTQGPRYRPPAFLFLALAFAFSIAHAANGARVSPQSATIASAAITAETRSISQLIITFVDPALARASRANAKLGAEHDALLTK